MIKTLKRIVRTGILTERPAGAPLAGAAGSEDQEPAAMQRKIRAILGRALAIRQVDAGSCNGCELEIHALNNPYYNIEGAGVRFVASPRHADMLLVTGPVAVNMEEALRRTYDAMPHPKYVVAVGDCGVCGGIFGKSYASRGGVSGIVPVHGIVPGCPPAPEELLRGILRAVSTAQPDAG